MWTLISRLFGWGQLHTVEQWAELHCKKASPTDLIAEAIKAKINADFEAWTRYTSSIYNKLHSNGTFSSPWYSLWTGKYPELNFHTLTAALYSDKHKIYVHFHPNAYDSDYNDNFHVNGVKIPDKVGVEIIEAFQAIQTRKDQERAKLARIKREMEESEKQWALAEDLLGMERNEFGALVPKVKPEEAWDNCDCDLGESCDGCRGDTGEVETHKTVVICEQIGSVAVRSRGDRRTNSRSKRATANKVKA